jgi:hypothetical protein
MKHFLTVPISDAVNRQNMKADTGGLHNAIVQVWPAGLPVTVNHDRQRLAGWMFYVGLHFEPGLTRVLAESVLPENQKEWDGIRKYYLAHLARRTHNATSDSIGRLREIIGSHLNGTEQVIDVSATALIAPGLAQRVFPKVFAQEDKDGLVPLKALASIHPGMFRMGELIAFAHPFFRRGESRLNTLNADLLHCLQDQMANSKCDVRVRLDPDMVGLAKTAQESFEFEYWYGPKFTDDLSSLQPGVTVHAANDNQRTLHQIVRTEFWWQNRLNDRLETPESILEIEELRNSENQDTQQFLCRYVHSIVERDDAVIKHLDGSTRGYDAGEMLQRLDQDIKLAGRHTYYIKLWRVDGDVPLDQWKKLIHHHFRGNPLVSEYLGAPPDLTTQVEAARDEGIDTSDQCLSLVPYRMNSADGIRLVFAYQPLPDQTLAGNRFVVARKVLSTGNAELPVLDVAFLELKKVLAKIGESLDSDSDAAYHRYEDRYHEFPLIMHRTRNAVEITLGGFRDLLNIWNDQKRDLVLALNIALFEDQRVLSLSLYGHIQEILPWLNQPTPFPPSADRDQWVNKTTEYLDKYAPPNDRPPLSEAVSEDDLVFRVDRVMLPDGCGTWKSNGYLIETEKLPPPIAQAMEHGLVEPAAAYWVRDIRCPGCSGNYLSCECSSPLEFERYEIREQKFAYFFWTDRRVARERPH